MEFNEVVNPPVVLESGVRTFFLFSDLVLRDGSLKRFRVRNCPFFQVGMNVKMDLTVDLFGNGKKKNLKGLFNVSQVEHEFDNVHGLSQTVFFTFVGGSTQETHERNHVNPPSIPVVKKDA